MKKLIVGLFILGFIPLTNAQTIELSETVIDLNYKYINAIDSETAPECVKMLKKKVLSYDNTKVSSVYNDEQETYKVSFYMPDGKIIAVYDKEGKIVKTIEKYNDVRLPLIVMQAVSKRFPNWGIVGDVYHINYNFEKDSVKQEYKIKIKNLDETIVVKTNENGLFL